jgi:hypothetical protein
MDKEYSRGNEEKDPSANLRQVDETYVFDESSGLYKPVGTAKKEEPGNRRIVELDGQVLRTRTSVSRDWFDYIVKFFGFLVSIGTLLLLTFTVIFSNRQWREAKRTADAAECALKETQAQLTLQSKSFYQQQRPWVAVSITEADLQAAPTIKLRRELIATKNTGLTPAVHVRFSCREETQLNSPDEVPDCEALRRNRMSRYHAFLEEKGRTEHPGISGPDLQKLVRQEEARDAQIARKSGAEWREWVIPPGVAQYPLGEGFMQVGKSGGGSYDYMVGVMLYKDLLDPTKTHTTRFCVMRYAQTPLQFCQKGQWMD